MTTFGFGSGSSSSNRNRSDRNMLRRKQVLRRSVLESLETRQLMTTGPQLIGVQPNEGSLIALGASSTPTVLQTSPRELVLRFDDGAELDATTLSGIQIKRAGSDGVLSSAYLTTDLGTNGKRSWTSAHRFLVCRGTERRSSLRSLLVRLVLRANRLVIRF